FQRHTTQVVAVDVEKIEGVEDDLLFMAFTERILQAGEIRNAGCIFDQRLAIDERGIERQRRELVGDAAEFFGPVQAAARAQRDAAVVHLRLQSITVEFYFMQPSGAARRMLAQRSKIGLDEAGQL